VIALLVSCPSTSSVPVFVGIRVEPQNAKLMKRTRRHSRGSSLAFSSLSISILNQFEERSHKGLEVSPIPAVVPQLQSSHGKRTTKIPIYQFQGISHTSSSARAFSSPCVLNMPQLLHHTTKRPKPLSIFPANFYNSPKWPPSHPSKPAMLSIASSSSERTGLLAKQALWSSSALCLSSVLVCSPSAFLDRSPSVELRAHNTDGRK
jgi:hypothetical protein